MRNFKQYWEWKLAQDKRLKDDGRCVIDLRLRTKVHIICPHDPELNRQFKRLFGRWRNRSKVWVFYPRYLPSLVKILYAKFSVEKITVLHYYRKHDETPPCQHTDLPCGPTLNGFRSCDCELCAHCPKIKGGVTGPLRPSESI